MGYQLKDICYPDQQTAVNAFFQSQPITFQTQPESIADMFFFQRNENNWSVCKQSTNSSQVTSCVLVENPVLAQCEYASDPVSNFMTGLELGGYVAAVIALAAIGKVIREKAI